MNRTPEPINPVTNNAANTVRLECSSACLSAQFLSLLLNIVYSLRLNKGAKLGRINQELLPIIIFWM